MKDLVTDLVTDLGGKPERHFLQGAVTASGRPLEWDHERTAALKQMWAEGMSASQIAAELGGFAHTVDGGRSAVIGKVHRLGLPQRHPISQQSARPAPPPRPKRERQARPARDFILRAPTPDPDPVMDLPADFSEFACTIEDLQDSMCRWPIGDPATREFRYCGDKRLTEADLSYCKRHARLAYHRGPKISDEERARRRRQGLRNVANGTYVQFKTVGPI